MVFVVVLYRFIVFWRKSAIFLQKNILIDGGRLSLSLNQYPIYCYTGIKYTLILCFSSFSVLNWLALDLERLLKWKLYKESIILLYSIANGNTFYPSFSLSFPNNFSFTYFLLLWTAVIWFHFLAVMPFIPILFDGGKKFKS